MSINNVEKINNFVLTKVCEQHIIVVEQQTTPPTRKEDKLESIKKDTFSV